MKTLRFGLLLALGLLPLFPAPGSSFPFRVGETLDYELTYLGIFHGSTRLVLKGLTTYQGVPAYRIAEEVDAGSVFKNHIEAWCRQSDLMPLLITTRMMRKGGLALGRQVYHPERRSATFSLTEQKKSSSATFVRQHPVQDVVTLLYYLRARNLAQGASFPVSMREGEFTLSVTGEESLKCKVEGLDDPQECWVIESNPPRIKAWLTTDERHLPIKVELFGRASPRLYLRGVTGV